MNYRTDVRMVNGQMQAAPTNGADTAKPLPKVEGTDRLQSAAWGDSWKKESDDPAIHYLADAQAQIANTYRNFMELRDHRSPEVTQAVHLKNVAQDFTRSTNRLAAMADRAQERASQRLQEIESQFREVVKWNAQDAQELRSVLRAMPAKDRSQFIDDALQSGDGQAMAAILGAHPSLSGITGDMQAAYRARAMQLHAPALLKTERTIKKASELTSEAFLDLLVREERITAKQIRDEYDAQARAVYEARQKASGDDGRWG